jgi:hypothetical protein
MEKQKDNQITFIFCQRYDTKQFQKWISAAFIAKNGFKSPVPHKHNSLSSDRNSMNSLE